MARQISVSTEPLKSLQEMLDYDKIIFGVADYIHCDVMDGIFVEQTKLEFDVLSAFAKQAYSPLDIHLMTIDLGQDYKKYLELQPKFLTVHYETFSNEQRLIEVLDLIRSYGVQSGFCVNPQTSIEQIEHLLPHCDLLLIMSVEAGYGGQKFMQSTYQKIAEAKKLLAKKHLSTLIEIDGGITCENAKKLFESGADILVSGNFVFNSQSKLQAILCLKA